MIHLDAFADALIEAHRTGRRHAPEGPVPVDAAEAYYVQGRVAAALGAVAGFKTALKPGQAPIMAPILSRSAFDTGAAVAMGDRIGIELEVAWKIIAPLPRPEAGDFASALARCVVPVPAIELVDTRLCGHVADDPVARLADFQINRGVVIGAPLSGWDGRDFGVVTARMQAGGDVLLDGPAEVPGGSALAALRALLSGIGDHCGGPRPGQIVITGSLHPLAYVETPGEVRGLIEGLGPVSVTLS